MPLLKSGAYSVVVSNAAGSRQLLSLNVVPVIDINMVPAITLKGSVGSTYRVDYLNPIERKSETSFHLKLSVFCSSFCDRLVRPSRFSRLERVSSDTRPMGHPSTVLHVVLAYARRWRIIDS